MPVIYLDQAMSGCLGCESCGNCKGCTKEALSGALGVNLISKLLTSVGLKDAITTYEGDMSIPDVFNKYMDYMRLYLPRINAITWQAAKTPLLKQHAEIVGLLGGIAPFFAPGGTWGDNQRARLAEAVTKTQKLRLDISAAERQYGNIKETGPTTGTPGVKAAGLGGSSLTYLLIGGGVLAAVALATRRRGTSSASAK
jgi:hypothetical protein